MAAFHQTARPQTLRFRTFRKRRRRRTTTLCSRPQKWEGDLQMNSISEISSLVKEYITPETVWLVPCLYALGSIIKRSIRIDDTLIPGVLCVVGIFLSALVSVASCEPTNWIQWVILVAVSIGQGYVLAAAAVCLNQLIKQHSIAGRLKKGFDGQEKTEVSDS